MRVFVKDKQTGKLLLAEELKEYEILYTEVNGPLDEATAIVSRKGSQS